VQSANPNYTRLGFRRTGTNMKWMSRIAIAVIVMTGRVTMLGISWWAGKGGSYRTTQRFFNAVISGRWSSSHSLMRIWTVLVGIAAWRLMRGTRRHTYFFVWAVAYKKSDWFPHRSPGWTLTDHPA